MPEPTFPAMHIRPRTGWLNDPNGVCQIDGRYHVFFQYNPDAPVHGNIHWGHVSSTDLLSWQEHPVALAPRPGSADGAGCWSGCIVDDGGTPTAVYTAVPDHAWNAGVVLARSDRNLDAWVQSVDPVVGTPLRPDIDEVRDPFVFTVDGHRYAVQGAGRKDGRPQLLLWGCGDLEAWVELGSLLTDDDPVAAEIAPANIWECPNLARIDDSWVLLVSLWRWVGEGAEATHQLAGVRDLVGDLVPDGPGLRFLARSGGTVDDGPAFYAPQLVSTEDRTLLWGWSWELDRSDEQVRRAGWAGVLTLPRELSLRDGVLGSRPAPELIELRGESVDWRPGGPLVPGAYELVVTGPARLQLDGRDVLDVEGRPDTPARVFLDGSMVERFVDGAAYTTRAYPGEESTWTVVAEAGHVAVFALRLPSAEQRAEG